MKRLKVKVLECTSPSTQSSADVDGITDSSSSGMAELCPGHERYIASPAGKRCRIDKHVSSASTSSYINNRRKKLEFNESYDKPKFTDSATKTPLRRYIEKTEVLIANE